MATAPILDTRSLNRALLDRQLLLRRRRLAPLAVLERLVGLQAQLPEPPYYGLWSRIEGFRPEDLARLVEGRAAVRIVLMRGTLHLVSAADGLAIRPLVQPVLDRSLQGAYGKRLAGVDLEALAAAARPLVEERPRTAAELGALLQPAWPESDPEALGSAARVVLPLVQVPPRGLWRRSGPSAHTTAELWLGRAPSAGSIDELALRYFGAFGPASVVDLQTWSGLTRLTEVVERLRPSLRVYRDDAGRELFDRADARLPAADVEAPPRFLAPFDNTLLSHADRTRILPAAWRTRVLTPNAVMPGTFLVDGFVAGTWKIATTAKRATLEITPFTPLDARDREALEEEAARLLDFAAGPGQARDLRFA